MIDVTLEGGAILRLAFASPTPDEDGLLCCRLEARCLVDGVSTIFLASDEVEFDCSAVRELASNLKHWLELPLVELGRSAPSFEISMIERGRLKIGGGLPPAERGGTIDVLVELDGGPALGSLAFDTDPSCLDQFVSSLRSLLTQGDEPNRDL